MDHKTFIASMSKEQRLTLTEKTNAHGLIHFAIHLGLVLVLGSMIQRGVVGWQLLMIVQGILIIFLFTLLHETLHSTVFKNKSLNTYVGYICGFLIFIPPLWFKYFHFAHHRYTQDPDKDPELAAGKPETKLQYILHVSGVPTWYYQLKTLLLNASGRANGDFIPESKQDIVRVESRILLKLYLLLLVVQFILQSSALLYVWIIPVLLGQPFLRLYLLAEHGRCPLVENMFVNTRTTFTNWVVRKLAWNMPFHSEHHAMPSVPFHALPALHELTKEHLKTFSPGYIDFHKRYFS